jgi:predicted phage terminase large subunit-like protein
MIDAQSAAAYERSRVDLTTFKHILYPEYRRNPHLDLLDKYLMLCSEYVRTRGAIGINRLIIEMPPRHGKTLTTSRLFPAWHLGRNPNHRVMLISYGASLAYRNSRATRNLVRSDYYKPIFPNVALADDSTARNAWNIAEFEGGVDAMGIGGDPTGKGAHILIIDDPVKNRAEAESEVYRERNWDAFTSDLYSRLEPFGVIIIMATRWHTDDLTGRALDMADEGWVRLRLPAFAETDDALGREVGQALWEHRYDATRLQEIRGAIGEYDFASLYQQKPMPSRGGLFDTGKIDVIDHTPDCKQMVRFYDLAVTVKKHSDYTAGAKIGITKDEDIIILHMYRVQKTMPDVEKDIAQNATLDGKSTRIRLEAEKAGIVQLDYLLRRSDMHGYTLDAKAPQGDKYTRAQPFASRVNAGKVKMVKGAWNRALLDELAVFPMGAHDDQVDALSGAYEMVFAPYQLETSNTMNFYEDYRGL